MKSTAISIVIAGAFIGGAILYTGVRSTGTDDGSVQANNVSIVDGKQIVEVSVKGGYRPQKSAAKAGVRPGFFVIAGPFVYKTTRSHFSL